jgi:hypothetical protein
MSGLGDMTAMALFKRLRASEHWLQWLARELGKSRGWDLPSGDRRYRAVDATVVSEPGSTGTDWRLHYSLDLSELQCDFFEITDVQGGEIWRRVPVSAGDVLLGDRIYGTPTGISHVLSSQGEVIVRVNHNALPLFDGEDKPFPAFRRFRGLRVGRTQQWDTYAVHEGTRLRGRLGGTNRRRYTASAKENRAKGQQKANTHFAALVARRAILLCLDEPAQPIRAGSGS